MFERNIEKELTHWVNDKYRKPLVLRGARQVGKTTVVRRLAMQFENFLTVNLEKSDAVRLFESTDNVREFMDEAPHNTAVRVWSGNFSVDEVKTIAGKSFRLINLPFYMIAALPGILKMNISGK